MYAPKLFRLGRSDGQKKSRARRMAFSGLTGAFCFKITTKLNRSKQKLPPLRALTTSLLFSCFRDIGVFT